MPKCYLGIDPGWNGAGLAIYQYEDKPWFEVEWIANNKPYEEQREWYEKWNKDAVCCHVEDVHGRGGWSAENNFTFGRSFQCCLDSVGHLDVEISMVKPETWQKHYGLVGGHKNKTSKKNKHKEKVEELFNVEFEVTHRICDAFLICWWGRLIHEGEI